MFTIYSRFLDNMAKRAFNLINERDVKEVIRLLTADDYHDDDDDDPLLTEDLDKKVTLHQKTRLKKKQTIRLQNKSILMILTMRRLV